MVWCRKQYCFPGSAGDEHLKPDFVADLQRGWRASSMTTAQAIRATSSSVI